MPRLHLLFLVLTFLASCVPQPAPEAEVQIPEASSADQIPPGFVAADGSRPLTFPADFGAHDEFRTEWWYYTGNLRTAEGRHFGFELTIFRVGLVSPLVELPGDSEWYHHSAYFAHFALSDIADERFYAFERYSRPGPGLAGAQVGPYRVWIEDWNITERAPGVYDLLASEEDFRLSLTLTDEMGVILHGEQGYSRKGENDSNASYYYSQPRLRADGLLQIGSHQYPVTGLAWKDHEFSSSMLDENQIGWDWFSLQFQDGSALMLFQLRERGGATSASSSGTFISANGKTQTVQKADFAITVVDEWRSPHTGGVYPAAWEVQLYEQDCQLQIRPWMADQEIHFPNVTYWEGAVHVEGSCNGVDAQGDGYIELTGYAGNLPLP